MLKKRDLHDCHALYSLMMNPEVSPYVRYSCQSVEEYIFTTKQLIVEEEQKTCISRTILDELGHPIGTIDLYQIEHQTGFLATWIGAPYFGKGYNQRAKELFFTELFLEHEIETIFLKIRKQNIRSKRAIEKLQYVSLANDTRQSVFTAINRSQPIYDLYHIERVKFLRDYDTMQRATATI